MYISFELLLKDLNQIEITTKDSTGISYPLWYIFPKMTFSSFSFIALFPKDLDIYLSNIKKYILIISSYFNLMSQLKLKFKSVTSFNFVLTVTVGQKMAGLSFHLYLVFNSYTFIILEHIKPVWKWDKC